MAQWAKGKVFPSPPLVTPVKGQYGPLSYPDPIHLNRAAVKEEQAEFAQDYPKEPHQEPTAPDASDKAATGEVLMDSATRKAIDKMMAEERERQRIENIRRLLTSGN